MTKHSLDFPNRRVLIWINLNVAQSKRAFTKHTTIISGFSRKDNCTLLFDRPWGFPWCARASQDRDNSLVQTIHSYSFIPTEFMWFPSSKVESLLISGNDWSLENINGWFWVRCARCFILKTVQGNHVIRNNNRQNNMFVNILYQMINHKGNWLGTC